MDTNKPSSAYLPQLIRYDILEHKNVLTRSRRVRLGGYSKQRRRPIFLLLRY